MLALRTSTRILSRYLPRTQRTIQANPLPFCHVRGVPPITTLRLSPSLGQNDTPPNGITKLTISTFSEIPRDFWVEAGANMMSVIAVMLALHTFVEHLQWNDEDEPLYTEFSLFHLLDRAHYASVDFNSFQETYIYWARLLATDYARGSSLDSPCGITEAGERLMGIELLMALAIQMPKADVHTILREACQSLHRLLTSAQARERDVADVAKEAHEGLNTANEQLILLYNSSLAKSGPRE